MPEQKDVDPDHSAEENTWSDISCEVMMESLVDSHGKSRLPSLPTPLIVSVHGPKQYTVLIGQGNDSPLT